MAKVTNVVDKTVKNKDVNLTINKLTIRKVDRTKQDIGDFRNAHRNAEENIMETRTEIYDLFDDAMLDPHLSSVVDKRLMAITNRKIRFVNEGEDVEAMKPLLKSSEFRKLLKGILNSQIWGYTVLENSFKPAFKVWQAPYKHLRPKAGVLAYQQHGIDGINYREGMFSNTMLEVGELNSFGLLLKAVPYVLYKRGCMGDWSQYIEIFGQPMRVGRYAGYDDKTRIELEKALDEAGGSMSIAIPKEADIEILESKSATGSSELYSKHIEVCDSQLSVLILGQTETTTSSDSSGYAQSKTHSETEYAINEEDRAFVLSVLEEKMKPMLAQAGFPVEGGEFMYEEDDVEITLKDRVDIDTKLKAAGLPIDDDYFYETYNIPKPKDYDKQKKAKASAQAPAKAELSLDNDLLQKLTDFFA